MTSVTEEMIEAAPSYKPEELARRVRNLMEASRGFIEHFNPHQLAEDKAQQWSAVYDAADHLKPPLAALEAALSASPAAQTEVAEAWSAIIQERQRQIGVEGWTPAHDDEHSGGEMLRAAVIYLHHGTMYGTSFEGGLPLGWPWEAQWWKPKDRRRNLERAGALCLAERDRCVRAGLSTGPADHKLGLVLRELSALASPVAQQRDGGWQDIATAPPAMHVMACRFDHDAGEWVYAVVMSPPIYPFTHWRPLPQPPALSPEHKDTSNG